MPKSYVIGHVTISDPEAYKAYAQRNDELLPKFGGRFLVRGGDAETVEGETKKRHVILEFDTAEGAKTFYNSPEYQENMKIRLENSVGDIVIVDGV